MLDVVATNARPEVEKDLAGLDNCWVTRLDVRITAAFRGIEAGIPVRAD